MATNVTDKLFEALPRLAGKVGAGGVTSASATTIPHTFVGLTNGNCYIVTANRTNATGTIKNQLNDTETFIGKVSSGNFIECVREVEGVAQAWAADTVLEILFTATGWNKLLEAILVEHGQDGKHTSAVVTTLKATGAEITTGTEDAKIVTPKAIADSKVSITDKVETLTNKTLTSPLFQGTVDGWVSANETWEYVSVDDPTGIFRVNADVTTKYSAGMRIKFTNGGNIIYGIITVVGAYAGGYTSITFLHQIDPTDSLALYLMANSAITANYYSTQKAPHGFPLSPSKWSVELVNTTNPEAPIAQNTWSNLGSVNITLPIGVFDVSFSVSGLYCYLNGTSTYAKVTLSTANNSESDADFTLISSADGATATVIAVGVNGFARKYLSITAKTVYYINFSQTKTGSNLVGCSRRIIRATCAYL